MPPNGLHEDAQSHQLATGCHKKRREAAFPWLADHPISMFRLHQTGLALPDLACQSNYRLASQEARHRHTEPKYSRLTQR